MSRKETPAPVDETRVPLPTRDDVLAFIKREREAAGAAAPVKIGKREIARAFNLKGENRIALKRMLRDLEADGKVERRGKTLNAAGRLPPSLVVEVTGRDRDGDLVALPADWDEADGTAPRIILRVPSRPRAGTPSATVGDRALVHLDGVTNREREAGAPYSGRIVKLLAKRRGEMLGVYHADPRGGGRVTPVDKKAISRGDIAVAPGDEGEAQDGDLVSVEPRGGQTNAARVREKLGSVRSEKAISLIAIHTHRIPNAFRADTLAAADAAPPRAPGAREDWRHLPLVTIDPADAKDHDDAVHAAPDADPANPGGHVLSVAIADVAAYVRPGSPLDREALDRGNSVYFPDRVVPMLPERISNDLCSLRPHEERPALAVRMIVDARGHKLGHTFHRILMRSAAKLSYAQAQMAIDGTPDETSEPLLADVLRPLWAAYGALREARERRQPLDLDLPERKILLKGDGTVDRVVTPPRLDAHRLIEEFMILANVAAAETLEDKKQMLVYRAHDQPTLEKLNALSEFLASLGIKLAKGQVVTPGQFNGILSRVRGTEHEHLVNEVVLRSQAQAEYVAENYGHFGLHLRRYAHFTSPIRRYADLIVHRALIRALHFGDDGLPTMERAALGDIAQRISAAERRAMLAERETTERLIATHLADRVGATFSARISGVTRAGLFVRLAETGADGFVPISTLGGGEFFHHEESLRALVGARSGRNYRLGDIVDVRLAEAAPFAGALRFEMISDGRARRLALPPAGRRAARRNGRV